MSARFLPLLFSCLAFLTGLPAAQADGLELTAVQRIFPGASALQPLAGEVPAYQVLDGQKPVGFALRTAEIAPISAYSGKPIDALVGLGMDGNIAGVRILRHEEPILVIGISDADLQAFTDQFAGKSATDNIRVGAHNREGFVGIDGISGATITTMVLASSVNKSIAQFAIAHGLPQVDHPAGDAGPSAVVYDTTPQWHLLWQERKIELVVLLVALGLLLGILFLQDVLVKRKRLFERLRTGYLLFTVIFIGFWCSAQLSVINLLAFFHSLMNGFSWDTLLIEPIAFVLWGFVAVSIVLWGRGVFCGWLCPFGAAQDLISKLATRMGFEGYQFPQMVHERLWAIKYILLIALVGLSLDSMVSAARLAEVEPFKTTFVLHFMREPVFVIYAIALLLLSAVNSKFYCKYLCALGAGLSFATRFKIFDWLRRRRECGKPCQACAEQCQIGAIRPTGEIIDNECHYCLECQVTYWDDHRCPPLVEKRKKREARTRKTDGIIASDS